MRARPARHVANKALVATALAALIAGVPTTSRAETVDSSELAQTLSGSYLAGRFARAENDTSYAAAFYGNALVFDPSSDMLLEQALLMEASQGSWDNAIRLAVEMTVASINRLELSGGTDEQAIQVRDAIRIVFPEAVTLVREARQGLR